MAKTVLIDSGAIFGGLRRRGQRTLRCKYLVLVTKAITGYVTGRFMERQQAIRLILPG
jgi:hypothetical protein